MQTPHVLPVLSLIYPLSPQDVPQEFLIFHYESFAPTNKISWLRLVAQLLKTPEAYLLQLVASTETPIGLDLIAFLIPRHPRVILTELILNAPPCFWHA